MADKVVARPLITIANVIWSFNPLTHLPQVLLVKRAYPPFEGHWALPETLLRRDESADVACIRLIKDKLVFVYQTVLPNSWQPSPIPTG